MLGRREPLRVFSLRGRNRGLEHRRIIWSQEQFLGAGESDVLNP